MLLNGSGSVIFTATFVGYTFASPGVAAYDASKSGLTGLTQALAAVRTELGACERDPARR
jgi:NAD(P)-dependent dehydrogenase (short-subunit alcohol dehydrogenase family)